jgi:hypothetical protein
MNQKTFAQVLKTRSRYPPNGCICPFRNFLFGQRSRSYTLKRSTEIVPLIRQSPTPIGQLTKDVPTPIGQLTKDVPTPIGQLTKDVPTPIGQLTKDDVTLDGTFETRFIRRVVIDRDILHCTLGSKTISLNLMVITTDRKVLLLQRSQSFHCKLVHRNLSVNDIRVGLLQKILQSLYPSELYEVHKTFFNFLDPPPISIGESRNIHIFPGGHSMRGEMAITTLLREFREETSIHIKPENLRFNKSYVFNVLIYDKIIEQWFDNLVFPALINMSSEEIMQKFKTTKHTRCPTFLNTDLNTIASFVNIQRFMLL